MNEKAFSPFPASFFFRRGNTFFKALKPDKENAWVGEGRGEWNVVFAFLSSLLLTSQRIYLFICESTFQLFSIRLLNHI